MKQGFYFVHALSPLHPGVGQGVGSVDLPVARERATGIPYLPGTSVKGVLRDLARQLWEPKEVQSIFGPDSQNASDHAGAAQFGDAKLLLLPVRSYKGVFAYATSSYLLERFARELRVLSQGDPSELPPEPKGIEEALTSGDKLVHEGKVYLEDLDFSASENATLKAWEEKLGVFFKDLDVPLAGRLLYLHDDAMTYLLETALEVVARIRLDEATKTVAQGALWYEENLPPESVLYGVFAATRAWDEEKREAETVFRLVAELAGRPLQFGGNATVGRGLSRLAFLEATP